MNFYVVLGFYAGVVALAVGVFLWGKPQGNSLFQYFSGLYQYWFRAGWLGTVWLDTQESKDSLALF